MLFNTIEYLLLFLPSVVIVYFLLNRYQFIAAAKVWLVLASFLFYCRHSPIFGLLLIASILFNYAMGKAINRDDKNAGRLLLIAVLCNLIVLGYFKYANFFIENLEGFLGMPLSMAKIVLPLGISFFTFTQIAYLVDVYRRVAHEYNLVHYFLFVTYFPHLVAGPILHHKEMMPQFADSRNNIVNWDNIFKGLFVFSIGLFKKVIIADQFALWANAGFGSKEVLLFEEAWITSLSYTLQIYFDFSGYADMAIGASLMLNIKLPFNFNSPYRAVNIQDFWRRWHITLSRWLRDYVYISLGGNQKGKIRTYLNVGITFLIGGLWHGANWTFIVWGALHGAANMLHKIWQDAGYKMPKFAGWLMTFLFVNAALVVFAAESLSGAIKVLVAMTGVNGFVDISFLNFHEVWEQVYFNSIDGGRAQIGAYVDAAANRSAIFLSALPWIAVWMLSVMVAPNSNDLAASYSEKSIISVPWVWIALAISLFALLFMSSRITEFIYFNF